MNVSVTEVGAADPPYVVGTQAKDGLSSYRNNLRASVRGFWRGVLGKRQFLEAMESTITRRLTQAWSEGAKECGIKPDDYTEEEQAALEEAIQEQIGFLDGFAEAIAENSQANKGKLEPLFSRADLWVNRYRDIKNRARVLACANQKLLWVIGPTEEHCKDCSTYKGRVYRGSVWAKGDIRPQHPELSCHGFRCLCQLTPTDKPLTKGKPPRMTG